MIAIEQIDLWAVSSGISHIVMNVNSGYVYTACQTWGNLYVMPRGTRTAEVCKRCREALPNLVRIEEKPPVQPIG